MKDHSETFSDFIEFLQQFPSNYEIKPVVVGFSAVCTDKGLYIGEINFYTITFTQATNVIIIRQGSKIIDAQLK